jgi:peptidoglycan/LPS O-acetylase OafA/YrhL
MNKLSHIDSLRGIAIIMVIVVHTAQSVANLPDLIKPFTTYCQMGVQLFFYYLLLRFVYQ